MNFNSLVTQIQSVQSSLQTTAAHAVNTALTIRNWLIGFYIVEFEQKGEDRAKYGEKLLQTLENKLQTKGLTQRRFREFRRLYMAYPQMGNEITNFIPNTIIEQMGLENQVLPIRHLPSAESPEPIRHSASAEFKGTPINLIISRLSYTHLRKIIYIDDFVKRTFYEMECMKGSWSVAELDRQINSLYYERSGLSKNKEALSALANKEAIQLKPKDIINSPVTLEFLGLNERTMVTETDLEQAILDNLQHFLLEMGHGFCFEARQKRILIDDEYFFIDLLFYHRVLKCHVVVELKVDKFRHEYASQLNMYLNYLKHEDSSPDDNPPIGILLCTEKGNTQVKYATAGLDKNIFVQKYMIELPDEKMLKDYITKEFQNFGK